MNRLWNSRRVPLPLAARVFVLGAPDLEGVHPGEVVRLVGVRIRGRKSLGEDFKAIVRLADGREVTPALICLESDQVGRMELFKVFFDLTPGAAESPK